MIKLKSILSEHWQHQPDPSLKDYLLNNHTSTYSGTVYHGTPLDGLKSMLTDGVWGTQHGEIAEYEVFSTSINSEVLRLFSEGNGHTGLEFKVKNINVLIVDDIIHKLLIELPGSGMEVDVDENELAIFCKQYKLPMDYRQAPYLPYNYLSSLGVDAFTFQYTWKHIQGRGYGRHNDEYEIGFIGPGIPKLNSLISTIYVVDEEFEIEDKNLALQAIEELNPTED